MTQLAANIRQKRLAKGYKQEALAKECNISQANLSYIESGKIKPSVEVMEKIAQQLETTVEELKHGVKEEINIENHNHPNFSNSNQTYNDIAHYFERERQQWQVINDAKDEIIKSQVIIIGLLKTEIERLKATD